MGARAWGGCIESARFCGQLRAWISSRGLVTDAPLEADVRWGFGGWEAGVMEYVQSIQSYINNVRFHNMNRMPVNNPPEQDLLDQAVEAVEQETGLRIKVIAREVRDQFERNRVVYQDAILRIDDEEYIAEVKAWAQHVPLGAVVDMVKRYPNGMLVADYVNPKMAERLRNLDVQFIDTAGNAFIRTPFHHVLVKGNRKPKGLTQTGHPRKRRGFTATGLKVTYAFLRRPELINEPYRVIAATADVALGTVGKVVDDLAAAGLLIERNGERRLVRQEELLETWVERYPAALRPKLQLGYFQAPQADWWADFPITELNGLWAGEIAGAHYTQYLRPVVATLYLPKGKLNAVIAKARLRKLAEPTYEAGMVEILAPFWGRDESEGGYVHPILAYADLIGTGDARNREVARKLYDERIARHFR